MKHTIAATIALLTATTAVAQTGIAPSPAYEECTGLATSDPAQALIKAEEWLKVEASIPAQHCRAMALFGLHRYTEAGEALNATRDSIEKSNISLRTYVTQQAVQAWINANRADAALATLSTQISDMSAVKSDNATAAKLSSSLMQERARIHLTYGKAREALTDLDHAVSLTPVNVELLLARATAFEQLGDAGLARADAQAVLTIQPTNIKAKTMVGRLDADAAAPSAEPNDQDSARSASPSSAKVVNQQKNPRNGA